MVENVNPVQSIGINKKIYTKTFMWMFLGLLATGIVSFFSYVTNFTVNFIDFWPILLIAEVIVVIIFSLLLKKLPPGVVLVFFFIYAILNGITLSTIFYIYELSSIVFIFFAAAVIFGICALYGKITDKDLSKFGTLLLVTLVIELVINIINIFMGNSILEIIIDWIILITFFGITAWDMQKVRNFAESGYVNEDKIAIYCAMELYLDFINIFLRILSRFGTRRD